MGRKRERKGRIAWVFVLIVAGGIVAGLAVGEGHAGTRRASVANAGVIEGGQPERLEHRIASARDLSRGFREAARRIEPSVVHITSETERLIVRRDLFGNRYQDRERGSGLGSGVIVSAEGHVLTNAHVIADATDVRVRLMDGRELSARIIGRDPATDLAVLKVESSGLTPAEFGDSDALEVGDWVLAVGSPFGFSNTVTSGIVSAKGRTGLSRSDADRFEDFIQTDAAINPGNSGGPLVDLDGRVVGINTAIFSRSGGSNGIGFAIPSALARGVLEAIVRDGAVRRGYLGVRMSDLRPEAIGELGIAETGGVLVAFVEEGSPAARAGLRERDIVTRFNGRAVTDSARLRAMIALAGANADAEIEVIRDGRRWTVRAALGSSTEALARRVGGVASEKLGLIVDTVTAGVLREIGYAPDSGIEGVIVRGVIPNSPAERAGIIAGDIIYGVGGRMVVAREDFLDAAEREALSEGVRVRLIRNGQRAYTDLMP